MELKNATVPLLSRNRGNGLEQASPACVPNAAESPVLTYSGYEIIDSTELGKRWNLPESWIRYYTRHSHVPSKDRIPHLKFGRYVRFLWGSPRLNAWLESRQT